MHMRMVPVSDICLSRMEENKKAIIGYMGFAPRATLRSWQRHLYCAAHEGRVV